MQLESAHDGVRAAWNARLKNWVGQTHSDPYRVRQEALVAMVLKHVTPCRTLDVGCGTGNLSRALHHHGFDVHGTDISDAMIAEAVSAAAPLMPNAAERFRTLEQGRIPFQGPFGLITAIGVLPYVADYPRYILELAGRLDGQGVIVASTTNRISVFGLSHLLGRLLKPSFNTAWWRETVNFARTGIWSGGHVDLRTARQAYSARACDALFAAAGFRLVDSIDIFNLPMLDRNQLRRGPVGRWVARRLGWVHRGVYRWTGGSPHAVSEPKR